MSDVDLRSAIRAAVAARRPVDARERVAITEFVRVYDGLTDPLSEAADRRHVTGSALVVSDDGQRVVLHKHKRLRLWLQPGGHLDDGESPWDAARREVEEETGLPLAAWDDPGSEPPLLHVDVHSGGRGHTHLDLRYLVTAPLVPPAPPDGESQDVRWFAWHQAIAMAEPGLEGILRALQPGEPKVRPARHNDAAECAQVYLRAWAFALPTVQRAHDDADVRRWMSDDVVGRTDMWVAEIDGVLAGLMVLDRGGESGGWIEHLYLDPAWIGRGLGDRLIRLAKERHPSGLQLWTFQVNEPAVRFYTRHGFIVEELGDGSGNEERTPDARLRWTP